MEVEMVNEIWAVISRSQRFRAGTVVAAWRGRGAAKAGGRLTLGDAGPGREAGEGTRARVCTAQSGSEKEYWDWIP